ncbi:hypothetical protein Zmor_002744 [Zophobas morio]|mgnify:CR=1 FL=1|uniref:Uncharacterized protein n=1 Tax=Zophobas morio TaxID=2755281 RepID=A0AA38M0P4_9CUCU|nr:hypothetical protein Zmor_002744 [Zophobas morio]
MLIHAYKTRKEWSELCIPFEVVDKRAASLEKCRPDRSYCLLQGHGSQRPNSRGGLRSCNHAYPANPSDDCDTPSAHAFDVSVRRSVISSNRRRNYPYYPRKLFVLIFWFV